MTRRKFVVAAAGLPLGTAFPLAAGLSSAAALPSVAEHSFAAALPFAAASASSTASPSSAPPASSTPSRVSVPVHRIVDSKAAFPPGSLQHFWSAVWPQAVRDFGRGGIDLQTTDGAGSVGHSAADRPLFTGLRRGVLNLMVTDRLPLYWDGGRSLAGATTLDRGYHLSMIAVRYAHGDRAPFLDVNTCVHEILHALLLDIFATRPSAFQAGEREYRVDWYATRLWLFHDGAAVRQSAQVYVDRLRVEAGARG